MPITKPFKRTIRQFTDNSYANSGKSDYIIHNKYAQSPEQYVRAFLLLQKDLINLFEYIEPADKNLNTYSYRIHELILRSCIEFEANCKAILLENDYTKKDNLNIFDYKKINITHRLSSYKVQLPIWSGKTNIRKPFEEWVTGGSLSWYQTYNKIKHNRNIEFEQATFDTLINAISGLFVILSAQFYTYDFIPGNSYLLIESSNAGIGDYFIIEFPKDWKEEEKYDFSNEDWQKMKFETDPFQKHIY